MPDDSATAPPDCLSTSRQDWCLPRPIQEFGLELLAQQLWCWGRDIERSAGNLMLDFGFEQQRYEGADERSTCYRLDQQDTQICLWGFGMFYGRRGLGGLFLSRFDFCPGWSTVESLPPGIHQTAELPAFDRPCGKSQWQAAHRLWTSLQHWIASYEQSVCEDEGSAYRQKCVNTWMRPFVHADRMAAAWMFLSGRQWEHGEGLSQMLSPFLLTPGK